MTEYAYSPMHAPKKHVSHEQMVETLKKRVRESVEKHQVSVRPMGNDARAAGLPPSSVQAEKSRDSSERRLLGWLKPVRNPDGTGYIESTCKTYVVGKAFVDGKPKYTASKRNPQFVWAMDTYDTAAEAQARCQQEFAK